MKYKVTEHQLNILTQNFTLIEDGLVPIKKNLIKESRLKEFLVRILIKGMPAELRIGAYSSVSALTIARNLFPRAIVTGSAIPIR